jgi:tetratricopeptide (TPR) repeat protein
MSARIGHWIVAAAVALSLSLSNYSKGYTAGTDADPDSADLYRLGGIAQYDEDNFESAVGEYRNVVRLDPSQASDHINLGLALMESNQLEEALIEFHEALRLDSSYVHPYYNLGICLKRLGRNRQSSDWLAQASQKDSTEVAAWYNLGVCLRRIGQIDRSREAFEKVLRLNPYNVNAHYNLMRIALSEKDRETYERERATFRKLKAKEPPSDLPKRLEICKYSYMIDLKDARPARGPYTSFGRSIPVRFTESSPEFNLPPADREKAGADSVRQPGDSGMLSVDVDRDGFLDLLVYGPAADRFGISGLYRNDGGKGFIGPKMGEGSPSLEGVTSCIAADYDNDDDTDIYCLRDGPNLLYRNAGGGVYVEVAQASGAAGEGRSVSAAIITAEDEVISGTVSGRLLLFRNNGDGSFSEIGADMGLIPGGRMEAVTAVDFDNDNDSDILLSSRDRISLYSNRLWAPYEEIAEAAGLDIAGSAVWPRDCNNDGHMDLLIRPADNSGLILMVNDGGGRFTQAAEWAAGEGDPEGTVCAWFDYDNDGFSDLLLSAGSGIDLMRGGPEGRFDNVGDEVGLSVVGEVLALETIDADGDDDDDVVILGAEGLKLYRNDGGDRNNSILVRLRGQKNNHDGIGSRVEIKAGRFYQKREVTTPYLRFGIGSLERVDVVRTWWANNVIQNAREVGADSVLEVLEKPGVLGSCPYVYAFDGETYRFVSDALVTSTMGFYLAPDLWFPPDGDEYLIIPDQMLDDGGGTIRLAITEELREITYIDQLKLSHVDIPGGRRLISNEIFRTSQPDIMFYSIDESRLITPVAYSGGREITDLIRSADGSAFQGAVSDAYDGITESQSLILELGELESQRELSLIVNGWVSWTNSSINRSIWQNNTVTFRPPYLQVSDGSGEWRTVLPEMGFPPGWFKTTIIDLAGLIPTGSRKLRIVTNLDIHWDEIRFIAGKAEPVRLDEGILPLSARLQWRGYSRTEYKRGDRPIDFIWSDPFQDAGWPSSDGYYTRYGDVRSLVTEVDREYVVMNHGEAVMVDFPAFGPVAPGCRRYYLLYLAGWCKDGDPNSLYSKTVGPLPSVPASGRSDKGVRTRTARTANLWEEAIIR